MRAIATAFVVCCALAIVTGAGASEPATVCFGDTSASQVEPKPGPRLRFGINPAGVAGALGRRLSRCPGRSDQGGRGGPRRRPASRLPPTPGGLQLGLPERPGERDRVLGLPPRPRRPALRGLARLGRARRLPGDDLSP